MKYVKIDGTNSRHGVPDAGNSARFGLATLKRLFLLTAALIAVDQPAEAGIRHYPAAEKVPFGTCADGSDLDDDGGVFGTVLNEEFNLVGCENDLKMYIWTGWSGPVDATGYPVINFSGSDAIRTFALNNNKKMRGHVLVYYQAVPGFLSSGVNAGTYTKVQVRYMTSRYIQAVVGRFKDVIHQWDVTNEILKSDGTLVPESDNFWRRNLTVAGYPDWLESIYSWARAADPDCKLYYCDYNTEHDATKFNGMMNVIQPLRTKGLIDGIAFQCHVGGDKPNVAQTLATHANAVAAAELDWLVSELDVEAHSAQAARFGEIANVCFTVPRCTGLMLWGVNDSHSWKSAKTPLILDQNYNKKPAYFEVSNVYGRIFPKPNTYYRISNRYAADKDISVAGGSVDNGARLQISNSPVGGSDFWRFVDIGSGYYKIENQRSAKSFDVIAGSTANGAGIQQYGTAPVPGNNQQWRLSRVVNAGRSDWISDDYYAVMNKNSGKGAAPVGGSDANNTLLEQTEYRGRYSQQWMIAP
jgi:endo-1,4-beta-xylanase